MKPILLHSCCAPCSAAIIEWLLASGVQPVVYYCNPNIYPAAEYETRKAEITRYCERLGLQIIDADYDHAAWLACVRGLEDEPERGARCTACFRMRLLSAAQEAQRLGIPEFATTLASSRWKSIDQINAAGQWAAEQTEGVAFLARNWRKGGLQQRREELLRLNQFYNQQYCGCEFSARARDAAAAHPRAAR